MAEAVDPDQQFATSLPMLATLSWRFPSPLPRPKFCPPAAPQPLPAFGPARRIAPCNTCRQKPEARLPQAIDMLLPIDSLGQPARALGHVQVAMDTDGTQRYEYPVVAYQEDFIPPWRCKRCASIWGWPGGGTGSSVQVSSLVHASSRPTKPCACW